MDDLSEREFRDLFTTILRFANDREPVVKIFLNSPELSQRALRNFSFDLLKRKLFWILHNFSTETLLFFVKNALLTRDPVNEIECS